MIQVGITVDIMYTWSLVWSKLSLLALYYRVFGFGYFKRACWAVMVLVVAWAITSSLSLFLLCVPLAKYWDPSLKGHCGDPIPVRLANSVATIVTDVIILCLPIPQIWGLHGLRGTERAGLVLLFALGFLSVLPSQLILRHSPPSPNPGGLSSKLNTRHSTWGRTFTK